MNELITINNNYSTTRILSKEKPIIKNNPEDKFKTILFLPKNKERKGEGGLRTQGYFKHSYEQKNGKWYIANTNKEVELPIIYNEYTNIPLITVITVVLNGEKYLEETIQSVVNQTYPNVEYIIIDGGSTDGTLDIIKKYEDKIDYWVSEPDKGIYDAMNKGIRLSTGEIIGILNSDDWYEMNSLYKVAKAFENNRSVDIISGWRNKYTSDKKYYKTIYNTYKIKKNINKQMPINHPSMFVKKNLYFKLGYYDTSLKLSSDYEFIFRAHQNKSKFAFIDDVITNMRIGGATSNIKNLFISAKEDLYIRKKYHVKYASFIYLKRLFLIIFIMLRNGLKN